MVPAFDCPADAYSLNAPELSTERPVYILEQRGHGYSDAPTHGRTVQRLAADVNEFIDFIGAPKVSLLGWSMGAAVLWAFIDLFGQSKVEKLVFVDQPPMLIADPYETTEERRRHGGQHIDLWHVKRVYNRDFYTAWPILSSYFEVPNLEVTAESIDRIPDDFARLISMIPEPPVVDKAHREFLAELVRNHIWSDWRGVFPLIEKPVLLLTGDAAHATTLECNEWVQETVRDCTWIRFSEEEFGGHDLCQTAYRKFNRCVSDFLR
ncbi:alpha/beta hydrolase [Brevibacterium sp.]|uniref:alpha/beta fold hydrolase n=1 Tax=Brevibacterium sp. TaxID=1701 RepID=UPI0028118B5F|nr:alpha/beta hydrolase [Brevibacterium sp.]